MIALDAATGSSPELYANAEWQVFEFGMEHRESGYAIERTMIDRRRPGGLWEWPLHLSEKSWCSPRSFRDAFVAALDLFEIASDPELARSFAIGIASGRGSSRAARAEAVRLGELVAPRAIGRRRPAQEMPPVRSPSAAPRRREEARA